MNFNAIIYEEQYEKYLRNPHAVEASWRSFFEGLERERSDLKTAEPIKEISVLYQAKKGGEIIPDIRVYNLIQAYRTYGHLMAKINPLANEDPIEPKELKLETHGLSKQDLSQPFFTYALLPEEKAPLLTIVNALKTIYCSKIGVEYMTIHDQELANWLQQKIEPTLFKPQLSIEEKQMILEQLNRSELLETFMHTKYVGQKRFSLEGAETLIPMLSGVLEKGHELGMVEFVIGMAHRGRLNVLCNILKKSYAEVFSEFDEGYIPESFEGSGDVKYHKGFTSEVTLKKGSKVKVDLCPNPSHLESVDPVVEGVTRARQRLEGDKNREKVLPILIHGDAAIAGQGVVYETMQMYHLEGYETGGTLHIVVNNQIGFTTFPEDARSTHYCTDIAKAFGAPVFHVNAEDPEGCVYATELGLELRQKFHCDVFIDLNCYRKYGHNESDEPAYTQPIEYKTIRSKKGIRELYSDELIQKGVLENYMAEALATEFKKGLNQALKEIKLSREVSEEQKEEQEEVPLPSTKVDRDTLQFIGERLAVIPEGLKVHPKLLPLIKERKEMAFGEKPIDWGMGETLAYGTLLLEGVPIRISGQDVRRGTFSHRHAILMDQEQEKGYFPLQHLSKEQATFEIYNSPLSENGVVGFEFGYSTADLNSLVIWEAQFGDFANGAQIDIDQFIATSEQKWGQKSRLTLLLPHGYEGQGPEHSSARIERFLSLCGHNNLWVNYPTTPAQLFHLFRLQMKKTDPKPLIVFTPKGLLRSSACVSSAEDLTQAEYQTIINDPQEPKQIKKLIFCTGRIYYDLDAQRQKRETKELAIVRVEQLYPLDIEGIKNIIHQYEPFEECLWVQEEPLNMGGWTSMAPQIAPLLPRGKELRYIGRERSAATATGIHAAHRKEIAAILAEVFQKTDLKVHKDPIGKV